MKTDQDKNKQDWLLDTLDCYEGKLIQYTAKITNDVEKARDVVQEAFLQLWKEERSKVESYVGQWLYTVCRNKAFDLLKKDKQAVSLDPELDIAAETDSPSSNIEARESHGSLLDAIQTLPANQREVISLKFQDELSYKEISKITGLSVSNVGFLIHKGIKTMRSILEKSEKLEASQWAGK